MTKAEEKRPRRECPRWTELGMRLRELRVARGLSLMELEKRLGLPRGRISDFECGKRIGERSLTALARFLRVPTQELLELRPARIFTNLEGFNRQNSPRFINAAAPLVELTYDPNRYPGGGPDEDEPL